MATFAIGPMLILLLLAVGIFVAVLSSMKGSRVITWVLGAVLLLVLAFGVVVLLIRPSLIEIEVAGTPGAAFVGEVLVDGQRHEVEGTTPLALEYQGREVDYTFILTAPDGGTQLKVSVEGGYCTDNNGVKGGVRRPGPFGFSYWQGGMGDAEWSELARRLIPPENDSPQAPRSDDASTTSPE